MVSMNCIHATFLCELIPFQRARTGTRGSFRCLGLRVIGVNWTRWLKYAFLFSCPQVQLIFFEQMHKSGQAPPLNGFETPFHWGYLSIVVFGAQRVRTLNEPSESLKHLECLEFLLTRGVPPDSTDIVGYTALHHVCISPTTSEQHEPVYFDPRKPIDAETHAKIMQTHTPQISTIAPLVRTLIKHGANVDHQNRYGEVALFCAFPSNNFELVDILLENGASLDIAEAEGLTPRSAFVRYGPQVTAHVTKWIRQREGVNAPREGGQKRCGNSSCGKLGGEKDGKSTLKLCSRCQIERYCSTECQSMLFSTFFFF